jgi:hypothetical protein
MNNSIYVNFYSDLRRFLTDPLTLPALLFPLTPSLAQYLPLPISPESLFSFLAPKTFSARSPKAIILLRARRRRTQPAHGPSQDREAPVKK